MTATRSYTVYYHTPRGDYIEEYESILQQPHILIAGATGAGKSVLQRGLMYNLLLHSPVSAQFVLIDPKRNELKQYKQLPHTLLHATEPDEIVKALRGCCAVMDDRYRSIEADPWKTEFEGVPLYIVIDELADLMISYRARVLPYLQKIAQLGRAARIHLIASTQSPSRETIPAALSLNFPAKIALRCDSAIESRQIIGQTGAENLPAHGRAIAKVPGGVKNIDIPLITIDDIRPRVEYWTEKRCFSGPFEV